MANDYLSDEKKKLDIGEAMKRLFVSFQYLLTERGHLVTTFCY
jgi:hypothetical protein